MSPFPGVDWSVAGPAWLAAIGTVAAFGVTTWALVRDHRLREQTAKDAAYDDALKVVVTASFGRTGGADSEWVIWVKVTNDGRREIRNVDVTLDTVLGRQVGMERIRLVQGGGWSQSVQFPTADDVWARPGGGLDTRVTTRWTDTLKTRWTLKPDGELLQ
jgi:hypothetical protein